MTTQANHHIADTFAFKLLETKEVLSESKLGKPARPKLRLTGIIQKCDEVNENMRVYPKAVMESAIKNISPLIARRAVIGELDHPADAKLHISNISHVMTKVWMEDKYIYGQLEILEDLPMGAIAASLVRNNIELGISSRGVGDMEQIMEESREISRVLDGYSFVTWDLVARPSVTEAVLTVMESKNMLPSRANRKPTEQLTLALHEWLRKR